MTCLSFYNQNWLQYNLYQESSNQSYYYRSRKILKLAQMPRVKNMFQRNDCRRLKQAYTRMCVRQMDAEDWEVIPVSAC